MYDKHKLKFNVFSSHNFHFPPISKFVLNFIGKEILSIILSDDLGNVFYLQVKNLKTNQIREYFLLYSI